MSGERRVGFVGRDARADELFALTRSDHRAPRAELRPVAWWPGEGAEPPPAAAHLTCRSVDELLATPGLDLVYLAGAAADDASVVRAVASSGLETAVFAPVAGEPEDVAALRVSTELRATLAGAQGLEALARGDVGGVLAVYVGVRVPHDTVGATGGRPGDTLRRWLMAALDLATTAAGGLPVRTFARASRLLGDRRDHLQLLLRFADDAIATIDLLALPAGAATADVEIEVTGSDGLLRLKPLAHQLSVSSFAAAGASERLGWHPEPIRVLVDDLLSVPAAASRVAPHGSAPLARWTAGLEARLAESDDVLFES